jgi:hypothetical protein
MAADRSAKTLSEQHSVLMESRYKVKSLVGSTRHTIEEVCDTTLILNFDI